MEAPDDGGKRLELDKRGLDRLVEFRELLIGPEDDDGGVRSSLLGGVMASRPVDQ